MSFRSEEVAASRANPGRTKLLIVIILTAAAVALLVLSATLITAMYYVTVDELQQRRAELQGRGVRVSGFVVGDSVSFDAANLMLRFELQGEGGGVLPVSFHGPKPDQLRDGAEAVVEGKLVGDGFDAGSVLLKCPSKYEEQGVSQERVEAVQ